MPMQSKVKTEFCFAYGPVSWVNLDSCDLFGSRDSWNDFKKGGQPFVPVILKLRRRKRNGLRKSRLNGRTLRLKMRLLAPFGGYSMSHLTRRELLKSGLAAGIVAATGTHPLAALPAVKQTATDWVPLGKSGVKVTRLALGTGSVSGMVQRGLGQDQFTRIVRYAYDQGIRFF